jgi:glycosyltransferase involved in cell wall biosynthesis
MRIALLSNFWYQRGGLERVMLSDAVGLQDRGHLVVPFASDHPLNEPTPFASYFPASVDHGALGKDQSFAGRATTAVRLFHNAEAVAAFDRLVAEARPQVVHQHGVSRQLSPSVLERAHELGIPTVLTLHDYSLRCPAGTLSRAMAPECVGLSCAGHRYDRAIRFSCVHGSRTASAIAAAELLVARALRRYERAVDLFLVPSQYVARRMIESGLSGARVRAMPNAIEPPTDKVEPPGSSVLAYGRLVDVKGFDLVISAARALPSQEFVIAGDGPERLKLERAATQLPNVRLIGLAAKAEIPSLIREAMAVVVPSVWPEPFGMVVLEAWREGRPVVVSRRGALPEIVDHGSTGIVFEPGNEVALTSAIQSLIDDPVFAMALGARGRDKAETTYSMPSHLDRLEATYSEFLS